jgi:hypothetical protein
MVNHSELLAIEWLKKTYGYSYKDIYHKENESPDFTCADGKKFEVKRLNGRAIVFSTKQAKNLSSDVNIIVFNNEGFVNSFLWGEREKSPFKISITPKPNNFVNVDTEMRKKLIGLKIEFDLKTINDAIHIIYDKYCEGLNNGS